MPEKRPPRDVVRIIKRPRNLAPPEGQLQDADDDVEDGLVPEDLLQKQGGGGDGGVASVTPVVDTGTGSGNPWPRRDAVGLRGWNNHNGPLSPPPCPLNSPDPPPLTSPRHTLDTRGAMWPRTA